MISRVGAEGTQFIRGEAHHAWLTWSMTAVLIITIASAASDKTLLVSAPDVLPIKYKHSTDVYRPITDVNTDFGAVRKWTTLDQ